MAVSVKAELNSKPNSDGTYSVMIRYTAQRKHKREGTVIRLSKQKYFNPKAAFDKANWISASCPQATAFNLTLKNRIEAIYKVVEGLQKENGDLTVEQIQAELKRQAEPLLPAPSSTNKPTADTCYLAFFEQEVERIRKEKPRHAENFDATLAKFKEFLGLQTIGFTEITVKLVKDYESWERTVKGNKQSTVNKSLERLTRIFNEALNEELIDMRNPFERVKRKKENKPNRRKLTYEEIERIAALELDPTQKRYHARNVFLLQFYVHGMRIGDCLMLKVGDFYRDADGRLQMRYTMEKTDAGIRGLLLVEEAVRILEPYLDGKKKDQFVFPYLSDDKDFSDKYFLESQIESKTYLINRDLKEIAKSAKLDDPSNISSHVARHSFAELARKSGASIYDISKGLRHGSIKITETYLSSFDDEAVNSLNSVYRKRQNGSDPSDKKVSEATETLLKHD
ncbi:site-specific integrase [Telluribacter humicola]|uniref:site-specific integrase n=1 Tax=Telluribacter humicola TaxID=1720261 RepID=UPI001A961872|nr:site-specific integrase [Telluribacter humicola]